MSEEPTTTEPDVPAEDVEDAGPVEITDRMKAIAAGEDPDEVAPPEDEASSSAESGAGVEDVSAGEIMPEWATEELVGLGETYGLGKEEIAKLSGPDELERFGAFYDRTIFGHDDFSAQGDAADPDSLAAPVEPAEPVEPAPELAAEPDSGTFRERFFKDIDEPEGIENGQLDPEQFADWDPDAVKVMQYQQETLNRLLDKLGGVENQANQYYGNQAREQEVNQINTYHDIVDELDPEFFGNSLDDKGNAIELPEENAHRRQVLLDQSLKISQDLEGRGKKDVPLSAVIRRAYNLTFGRDAGTPAGETKLSGRPDTLKAQSNSRRRVRSSPRRMANGTFAAKSPDGDMTAAEIVQHPDVRAILDNAGW